jgi:hypothetical protein
MVRRFVYSLMIGSCVFAINAFLSLPVQAERSLQPASPANSETAGATTGGVATDDSDPAWLWSGMAPIKNDAFRGGSAHGGGPGTYGAYVFQGTGVRIIGYSGMSIAVDGHAESIGKAKITVDGQDVATTTLTEETADYAASIYTVRGLKMGSHVVKITASAGWVVVDSLIADGKAESDASDHAGGRSYYLSPRSAPQKVLETWPGLLGAGTIVDVAAYVPGHGNGWWLDKVGDGLYHISPIGHRDLALAILPALASEAKLGVVMYSGAMDQLWLVSPADGGGYRLLMAGDRNRCLNVAGARTDDGAPVLVYPWQDHATNDQWILTPIEK